MAARKTREYMEFFKFLPQCVKYTNNNIYDWRFKAKVSDLALASRMEGYQVILIQGHNIMTLHM